MDLLIDYETQWQIKHVSDHRAKHIWIQSDGKFICLLISAKTHSIDIAEWKLLLNQSIKVLGPKAWSKLD